MKTNVVHCQEEPYDIYIGRKKDTDQHYGNPFRIGDWGCSRKESIHNFTMWITGQGFYKIEPARREWIMNNINELKDKTLGCWCKPKDCHGDVYVEILEGGLGWVLQGRL